MFTTGSGAFGDAAYKQSGGPGPEDHPVTADPEFLEVECEPTDFVVLVCDGICEGSFTNAEVVQLAAAEIREHGDPGRAATAVCRKALQENSKDNLSCMIVLLRGGVLEPVSELLPGPFSCPRHAGFTKAYGAAAVHAGVSLAEAVERRYSIAKKELEQALDEAERQELQEEIRLFEEGPPDTLAPGSQKRREWFEAWLQAQSCGPTEESDAKRYIAQALMSDPNVRGRPLFSVLSPSLAYVDSSEPQVGSSDSTASATKPQTEALT